MVDAGRNPRHHDQSISVFLAGQRRGGRRKSGRSEHACSTEGSDGHGPSVEANGCRCWHVFFECGHVFIILTTALTLNRHGITHIETSRQAAEALRPFAGKFAATLFTVGIVGVGFLAIPTLAGSAAYAFAETLGWRQGLDKKLSRARSFYAIILLSTAAGVVL